MQSPRKRKEPQEDDENVEESSSCSNSRRDRSKRQKKVAKFDPAISMRKEAWSAKEKEALLRALIKYGSRDFSKLANEVQTRNSQEVRGYLERVETNICTRRLRLTGVPESHVRLSKWAAMMYRNKLLKKTFLNNCKVLIQLFETCAQSYPELSDPDPCQPDFRAMYQFIADILAGRIPAALSPMNSFLILRCHRILKAVLNAVGVEEEKKYLLEFASANTSVEYSQEARQKSINIVGSVSDQETETEDEEPERHTTEYDFKKRCDYLYESLNPLKIPKELLPRVLTNFMKLTSGK